MAPPDDPLRDLREAEVPAAGDADSVEHDTSVGDRPPGPYVGSARPPTGALVVPAPASAPREPAADAPAPEPGESPASTGSQADLSGEAGSEPPGSEVRSSEAPGSALSGTVLGRARVTGSANGSASVTVRASAAVPRPPTGVDQSSPPDVLTQDDESLEYVEGRPGRGLAEDLAEQRLKELPTAKEVTRAQDEKRRIMPLWQEIPLLVVVSFCVAVLVRSFLVQAFVIPSESMVDTLRVGDRVMVNKIVYETRDPRRGEVVVFRGTDAWAAENIATNRGGLFDRISDTLGDLVGVSRPGEKDFIKRVIGLSGDRVACCDDGRVTVNGVAIDEPYLSSNSPLDTPPNSFCGSRRFAEVIVPPGQLFVMGDNRGLSQDSRCQGTVPIENVIGRAFLRVWPPSRWGGIGTPSYPDVGAGALRSPATVPDPSSATVALALLATSTRRSPARRRRDTVGTEGGPGAVRDGCAVHVRCVRD